MVSGYQIVSRKAYYLAHIVFYLSVWHFLHDKQLMHQEDKREFTIHLLNTGELFVSVNVLL